MMKIRLRRVHLFVSSLAFFEQGLIEGIVYI